MWGLRTYSNGWVIRQTESDMAMDCLRGPFTKFEHRCSNNDARQSQHEQTATSRSRLQTVKSSEERPVCTCGLGPDAEPALISNVALNTCKHRKEAPVR